MAASASAIGLTGPAAVTAIPEKPPMPMASATGTASMATTLDSIRPQHPIPHCRLGEPHHRGQGGVGGPTVGDQLPQQGPVDVVEGVAGSGPGAGGNGPAGVEHGRAVADAGPILLLVVEHGDRLHPPYPAHGPDLIEGGQQAVVVGAAQLDQEVEPARADGNEYRLVDLGQAGRHLVDGSAHLDEGEGEDPEAEGGRIDPARDHHQPLVEQALHPGAHRGLGQADGGSQLGVGGPTVGDQLGDEGPIDVVEHHRGTGRGCHHGPSPSPTRSAASSPTRSAVRWVMTSAL